MVLQVFSDARKINKRLDAQTIEQVGVADTGQFQELGSVEDPTRKDDFLRCAGGIGRSVVRESNAGSCVLTGIVLGGPEVDLCSLCARQNEEIRLVGARSIVSWCGVRAHLRSGINRSGRIVNADIVSRVLPVV